MLRRTTVEVEVKSLDEIGRELDVVAGQIKVGKEVAPIRKIIVPSLEAARKILSQERLRLMAVVEEKRPQSLYELAKLLGRDRRNVVKDVEYLASLGLIHLAKERKAKRFNVPTVNFARINIGIDLRNLIVPA